MAESTAAAAAEIWQILKETGAYQEGHFRLTSGLHSDQFMLCGQALQYPHRAERLCRALAAPWRDQGIAVVVGPAMGGVLLAYEVARALGEGTRALYTEKDGQGMALRRGFRLNPGERVLVVEDALSTGGSVLKCLEAIRPHRPEIAGVSVLVDRTGGAVDLGVPLRSVLSIRVPQWEPAACPLCAHGEPLSEPKR